MNRLKAASKFKLSIRTRVLIFLMLLTTLPFLAYRFAVDLHRIMLNNQAIVQQQTVENLALILENRTDLWALQIQSGHPTRLAHLNLSNSVLWVVNEYGKTTYVVGQLPKEHFSLHNDFYTAAGKLIIKTFATVIPYSLPYPYPQSLTPEKTLIENALRGRTLQQYRMNRENQPISLMSATPLMLQNRIIGALVLEQKMENLFSESLDYFYRLIGIGALIFVIVIVGVMLHTAALSNRIIRLDNDVKKTYSLQGHLTNLVFPEQKNRFYYDELSDLRQHIDEMLKQLSGYERYLKQLPKTLRHELHNPLNRLSMALTLLEKDTDHSQLEYAQHALAQLKQIIASLSEATSIEDSLHSQTPEAFPIAVMLDHYMHNNMTLHPEWSLSYQCRINKHAMVMGDGFMLEQMMDKLLSNAIDFSDGQQPVHVDCQPLGSDKVIIRVQNSGPALPEGYEQQIFDGMTSIRTLNQGQTHLGLGLYIVKLIVDFHKGNVFAENMHREKDGYDGVRFNIELPLLQQK
ncbi:ATP-binding protein [Thiomicrorhabdus sp.]|uniref:ATP-binding protein n=1 Tax=Thiomicrorhabdus sp. TaxID=2039724 RepID=UPI0029C825F7|nr:ATP-binding protein [Thiomicrorhabdus sp.]